MLNTNVLIRKRITALFLIMAVALFFLIGKLAWIQFVRGNELQKEAMDNRLQDIRVDGKRGTIYDRNHNELVRSISADTLYAIPNQIKSKEKAREIANELAAILGDQKPDDIYQKLIRKSNFEYIERKMDDKDKVAKIKAKKFPGIAFHEDSKRIYPNDNLASHVLGFVGLDNKGLSGVEATMDKTLRGTPGWLVIERDAYGRDIPQALHKYIPAQDGEGLVLTIDETIQHFVERELDKIMIESKPKGATIIAMDPKTGEILAMANRPDYNPNHWQDANPDVYNKNGAVWFNYEPGSTFKVVTASSALEEGTTKPEDKFFDPGFIMVDGERINCWAAGGHGSQTFVEVVQNSCNPGFIDVGLKLGKQKFYKYINAFGFGRPTGIELPGEASGILYPEKDVTKVNLATMSIGQSISVTPIQLISAVATVCNDGKMIKPHIVKQIVDKNGKVVKNIKPEVVRQVISKDTAKQLRTILERVVTNGSGKLAQVEGYHVGGKTGTAQKAGPNGGYMSGKYIGSFVGFAPVDDPRIVILVVVDEPEGSYYGSQVAAPRFQAIARDALREMKVPPEVDPKKLEKNESQKDIVIPNVTNAAVNDAINKLNQSGLKYRIEGEGQRVYGQFPKAGGNVPAGTEIVLYVGKNGKVAEGEQVTVPDVTGLNIRDVGELFSYLGIRLEVADGATGYAVTQSVDSGTKVKAGSAIKVKFEPPAPDTSP